MTLVQLRRPGVVRIFLLAVAELLPIGLKAQSGGNYSYVNVDFPGALFSTPEAVTDYGKVVGYRQDTSGNLHGYYWDGTNYTRFDSPGAIGALAEGINNAGVISGLYETNSGTNRWITSNMAIVPNVNGKIDASPPASPSWCWTSPATSLPR